MTREQIEEQIGIIAVELHRLNRIVTEGEKAAQKADKLRVGFQMLMRDYLGEVFRDRLEEERKKTVYVFKGKIKDLLAELQSEIQKAE